MNEYKQMQNSSRSMMKNLYLYVTVQMPLSNSSIPIFIFGAQHNEGIYNIVKYRFFSVPKSFTITAQRTISAIF